MTLQETNPAAELETLDGTKPDSVESWANDAPLKLVAWALDSHGPKGQVQPDQKQVGSDFVRDPDSEWKTWETWWKRVLPAVKHKDSEPYFGRGNGTELILLSKVTDVPAVPWNDLTRKAKKAKTKAPTVTDWKRWMLSDDASPPPGPRPTKAVCTALAKLPAKDVALALHRIMEGAAELLESGSPSSHVAAGWAEAVSRGFVRFRELMPPDAVLSLAPQVGELLARLFKAAWELGGARRADDFGRRSAVVAGDVAAGFAARESGKGFKIRRQRPRPARGTFPNCTRPVWPGP